MESGHMTHAQPESLLLIWGHWLLRVSVCVEVFRCYHGAAHAACTSKFKTMGIGQTGTGSQLRNCLPVWP